MPKKPNTVMKELAAAEFGSLLQEGKIVQMRGGKAIVEHTKTLRGKKKVTTYHLNLSPQIVHQELPEEAVVPVVPVVKKPRKKAAPAANAPVAKKPAAKKPAKAGRRKRRTKKTAPPAAKPAPAEKAPVAKKTKPPVKPAKPSGRKARTPKPAEKTAPAATPAKKKKPAAAAQIPWNEDLGDDDFEL